MKYICQICGYVYDEEAEGVPFSELPDDWACPMCRAPKSMFAPEEAAPAERKEAPASGEAYDDDMQRLPPGVLAAIFSNLARGSEKQYKEDQAAAFSRIADCFTAAAAAAGGMDISDIKAIADEDAASLYPAAKKAAEAGKDRGALRACTWGEKTERMIQALVNRYIKEGESFLEDTEVWVCSICGFIYIGDAPPSICPVCKVPDWKFEKAV